MHSAELARISNLADNSENIAVADQRTTGVAFADARVVGRDADLFNLVEIRAFAFGGFGDVFVATQDFVAFLGSVKSLMSDFEERAAFYNRALLDSTPSWTQALRVLLLQASQFSKRHQRLSTEKLQRLHLETVL